jgi:hypothetical protein
MQMPSAERRRPGAVCLKQSDAVGTAAQAQQSASHLTHAVGLGCECSPPLAQRHAGGRQRICARRRGRHHQVAGAERCKRRFGRQPLLPCRPCRADVALSFEFLQHGGQVLLCSRPLFPPQPHPQELASTRSTTQRLPPLACNTGRGSCTHNSSGVPRRQNITAMHLVQALIGCVPAARGLPLRTRPRRRRWRGRASGTGSTHAQADPCSQNGRPDISRVATFVSEPSP